MPSEDGELAPITRPDSTTKLIERESSATATVVGSGPNYLIEARELATSQESTARLPTFELNSVNGENTTRNVGGTKSYSPSSVTAPDLDDAPVRVQPQEPAANGGRYVEPITAEKTSALKQQQPGLDLNATGRVGSNVERPVPAYSVAVGDVTAGSNVAINYRNDATSYPRTSNGSAVPPHRPIETAPVSYSTATKAANWENGVSGSAYDFHAPERTTASGNNPAQPRPDYMLNSAEGRVGSGNEWTQPKHDFIAAPIKTDNWTEGKVDYNVPATKGDGASNWSQPRTDYNVSSAKTETSWANGNAAYNVSPVKTDSGSNAAQPRTEFGATSAASDSVSNAASSMSDRIAKSNWGLSENFGNSVVDKTNASDSGVKASNATTSAGAAVSAVLGSVEGGMTKAPITNRLESISHSQDSSEKMNVSKSWLPSPHSSDGSTKPPSTADRPPLSAADVRNTSPKLTSETLQSIQQVVDRTANRIELTQTQAQDQRPSVQPIGRIEAQPGSKNEGQSQRPVEFVVRQADVSDMIVSTRPNELIQKLDTTIKTSIASENRIPPGAPTKSETVTSSSQAKLVVETSPAAEPKRPIEARPSLEAKPSAEAKPSSEQKPAAEVKSSPDARSSLEAKRPLEPKGAVDAKPPADTQSNSPITFKASIDSKTPVDLKSVPVLKQFPTDVPPLTQRKSDESVPYPQGLKWALQKITDTRSNTADATRGGDNCQAENKVWTAKLDPQTSSALSNAVRIAERVAPPLPAQTQPTPDRAAQTEKAVPSDRVQASTTSTVRDERIALNQRDDRTLVTARDDRHTAVPARDARTLIIKDGSSRDERASDRSITERLQTDKVVTERSPAARDEISRAIAQNRDERAPRAADVVDQRIIAASINDGKSDKQTGLTRDDALNASDQRDRRMKPEERYLTGAELAMGLVMIAGAIANNKRGDAPGDGADNSFDYRSDVDYLEIVSSSSAIRTTWLISCGETLTGLGEKFYDDARVGYLIADINAGVIREAYIEDKRICELHSRQMISLPNNDDLNAFYRLNLDLVDPEKLVTVVSEREFDRQLVNWMMSRAMGVSAAIAIRSREPGVVAFPTVAFANVAGNDEGATASGNPVLPAFASHGTVFGATYSQSVSAYYHQRAVQAASASSSTAVMQPAQEQPKSSFVRASLATMVASLKAKASKSLAVFGVGPIGVDEDSLKDSLWIKTAETIYKQSRPGQSNELSLRCRF